MPIKKRYVTIVILVALAICAVVFSWFEVKHRNWSDIKRSGVLRVVTDYSEMDYFLDEGVPSGFNFELIRMFADSIGLQLEITVEADYAKRVSGVRKGEYDVMISQTPINAQSQQMMHMSVPTLVSGLVLVQRDAEYVADSLFVSDIHDLEGAVVCVEANSPYMLVLENIKKEYCIDFEIRELSEVNSEMLCGMVVRGDIVYAAIDRLSARIECGYHSILDCAFPLSYDLYVGWGISNVNALQESVNDFITSLKGGDEWNALRVKYIGER